MTLMPYIHFTGHCAEAMAFYCDVLGGSDLQMMRYADAPPGTGVSVPGATEIMHSQFTSPDGSVLMASDFPPGMGEPQAGMSIMIAPDTVEEARGVFERLAVGGAVVQPFQSTFFSPGFGMCKDRFGTHWIIGATSA